LALAALAIVNWLLTAVVSAEVLIFGSVLPLVCIFAFVLNALLFVEQPGSLSSRFPRYLFAFPVPTRTLAIWPNVLATLCVGLLWAMTTRLIGRSANYQLPVVVPALGLAAMMAWAQALAWAPIAVIWLREVITVSTISLLVALPIWAVAVGQARTEWLGVLFAGYIVAAFVLSYVALNSDRHGRSWGFWLVHGPFDGVTKVAANQHHKRPFRNAFEAQVWYEWNCHGLMLNGFVCGGFFVIWCILVGTGRHGDPHWFATIIVIFTIMVPTFIAASAASFGRFRPFWSRSRDLNSFVPTRPTTTLRLVTAKFRMGAASVLVSWTWAVALTAIWIFISGNQDNAAVMIREFFSRYPGARGVAIMLLSCGLLPALSWRFMTWTVAPTLAGRRWVDQAAIGVYLTAIFGLAGSGFWLSNHPEHLAALYSALPWLVASVALLKGGTAVAAFRAALRQGLFSWRNVVVVLGVWSFITCCGIAWAVLVGPSSAVPESSPVLALAVASFVPLARFPLATLALDWNRHR
jgi:hypothetical protein